LIGALSNTKDVGWALIPSLANINFHCSLGIDGEPLIGIDGNAEEARVGIDEQVLVPHN
jgi:hypothetical protein